MVDSFMEQLEHIFRRTQCAWYNVEKLKDVCKKVDIVSNAVAVLLKKQTGEVPSVEGMKRLLKEYRTVTDLLSELRWMTRFTNTMLTAIPVDHDYRAMMKTIKNTRDFEHKQIPALVSRFFELGQKVMKPSVLTLQKKYFVMYGLMLQRDADVFITEFKDPAWIEANCSQEWSRHNVTVFLDWLIDEVGSMTSKVWRRFGNDKLKPLRTTFDKLIKAREQLKQMDGQVATVKTTTQEVRENAEEGKSAEKEEGGETDELKRLADTLLLQFVNSFSIYRSFWKQLLFGHPLGISKEALENHHANLVDEQMKVVMTFEKLCTYFPDGEHSPKLDLFKSDMELLFRKAQSFYQVVHSLSEKPRNVSHDRMDAYNDELEEHAENIEKMLCKLRKTVSIKLEEIEEYRIFVDSELCFLKNYSILEEYITACQLGETQAPKYKILHKKSTMLLKTCEYLKYYLSVESTLYSNSPLWDAILCDGRALSFAIPSEVDLFSVVPVEKMLPFVKENGLLKLSETPEDNLVFGSPMISPTAKTVPAETVLNLLMRQLEESASKEAAERALLQLGLMGTFTKDRLVSVFPAESPVLPHLLGHLPKKVKKVPEKAPEQVLKPSAQKAVSCTTSKIAADVSANKPSVLKINGESVEQADVKPNIKAAVVDVKKEKEDATDDSMAAVINAYNIILDTDPSRVTQNPVSTIQTTDVNTNSKRVADTEPQGIILKKPRSIIDVRTIGNTNSCPTTNNAVSTVQTIGETVRTGCRIVTGSQSHGATVKKPDGTNLNTSVNNNTKDVGDLVDKNKEVVVKGEDTAEQYTDTDSITCKDVVDALYMRPIVV